MSSTLSPATYAVPGRMMVFSASLIAVVILISATKVYAVQGHGGAEGLISHQLGHALFTLAMFVLLLRIKKFRLTGAGWREFTGFLYLIIFWNILTFSGHWMREYMSSDHFIHHHSHIRSFRVDSLFDLAFYLTRLDHLLLVPAFFLLLLAIHKWGKEK